MNGGRGKILPVAYLNSSGWLCPECFFAGERSAVPHYDTDMADQVTFGCARCSCGRTVWPQDPQPPEPCVFCDIIAGEAEVEWVLRPDTWPDVVAFIPLNPVTEGHCLVVPKTHVRDFAEDPEVTAAAVKRAAELMRFSDRPMNLITSRGREATQSVFHLHWHLVPRRENDGLALPWYSGKRRK